MVAKKKSAPKKQRPQKQRFIEAAKEHGAEDGNALERVFGRIVPPKPGKR